MAEASWLDVPGGAPSWLAPAFRPLLAQAAHAATSRSAVKAADKELCVAVLALAFALASIFSRAFPAAFAPHSRAQTPAFIEEISQVDTGMLEFINCFLKKARGQSAAFGGIRVIVFGDDFCQLSPLPPSSKNGEVKYPSTGIVAFKEFRFPGDHRGRQLRRNLPPSS